jgi:hypothetical protein
MVIKMGKLHLRFNYIPSSITLGIMAGEASATCIGISLYLLFVFIHLGYGEENGGK